MTITFPKFRIPSLGELWSLFFAATHVSQLVASIERQAAALEAVVAHQLKLADKHQQRSADLHIASLGAQTSASLAREEAARAARVSGKLAALTA